MFPNRLKLGLKRKQSMNGKPTKLSIVSHDFENMENTIKLAHYQLYEHPQNAQLPKSNPNISESSTKFSHHQLTNTVPFAINNQNYTISHAPIAKMENSVVNATQIITNSIISSSVIDQDCKNLDVESTAVNTQLWQMPLAQQHVFAVNFANELKVENLKLIESNEEMKAINCQLLEMNGNIKGKNQQLKTKCEWLGQENDRLKNRQKILQVQVNNCSKQHYEKEYTRLKSQNQSLQIHVIDLKHRLEVSDNDRRQNDSQSRKRADQIKSYIKQLQRQRTTIIQLKNQINDKERGFKSIIQEIERSNLMLSQNYEQLNKQHQKGELIIREKSSAIESMNKQMQILINRNKQNDSKMVSIRKSYEEQLQDRDRKIYSVEGQLKIKNRESQQLIDRLNSNIQNLQVQRDSQALFTHKKIDENRNNCSDIEKSLRIVRLEETVKQIGIICEDKDKIIANLENKLKEYFSPEQYCSIEKRCKDLEDKRLTSAKYYQEKLLNLQKQNEKHRLQKLNAKTVTTSSINQTTNSNKDANGGFNELLRKNVDEIAALKQELLRQVEQNQAIKEEMLDVKLKEKKYLNDIDILNKRIESSSKNFNIDLDVERQKFINDIQSLKRKMTTLETRLQYKSNENKQKDEFIKNTIIGRAKTAQIPVVVAELERIFLQKERLDITK